jgi:signal transduction histidine kinase
MAVVYGLIIVIAISTLDVLIIMNYKQDQLEKNQARQIMFAEIIANVVKDKLDDSMELNGTVRENSAKLDGRVLVINSQKKVLADNFAYYIGKQLDNDEATRAIELKEQIIQHYNVDNQNIMIVAAPILEGYELKGVVLISVYIDHIYKDVRDLANQVMIISVIACAIAIYLSFMLGRKLSKPIEELTLASEEILKGKLDTKVDIVRKDEIGQLADTFNKMSQELYKTDTNRRRFISDVSHELKTPLTSIKVLIESLIDSRNDTATYDEYLGDINGEIDRLSLLVKSLLTLTRLEEVALSRENISICDEVAGIIKLYKPFAEQHEIQLINNCNDSIQIYADKSKLREILVNLVDNSIKYGRSGGYVEISCNKSVDMVELSIVDNGNGIPAKDIDSIFDIFYRVDESRTRETGGSGIGLYLVKKLVELHGWSIKVSSQPKVKTEFVIEIGSDF